MENLPVKELREIAKKAGVQGYGKFRKAELLEVLADVQPDNLTVRVLRIMAKKLGTKGYAKMRKTELINVFGSTQASEANIPISGPVRATTAKPSRASNKRVIDLARNEIKKFTDWILTYIPDPTKRVVSKRLRDLQKKVSQYS